MEIQVHGALVEVLGVGVLLRGKSGAGKSECALELLQRGHRLVADDVVRIRVAERAEQSGAAPAEKNILLGTSPELIRHYMELRGIGLLFIPDILGSSAVLDEAPIELVCHLEEWEEGVEYERIGLERAREALAGISIPRFVLPVRPAGNMATLVEVAVRDHQQRSRGVNAARRLDERLREEAARERTE